MSMVNKLKLLKWVIELGVSLRQAGLRQGWTVACTSVFTFPVPNNKQRPFKSQN